MTQEELDGREAGGKVWGKHAGLPALSRHMAPPALPQVHQPRSSQTPSSPFFFFFMKASLHRWNWLNHWPLMFNSTSSLSSLPGDGGAAESSNPLLTSWVSCQPASILRCGPKGSSYLKRGTPSLFSSLRKSQELWKHYIPYCTFQDHRTLKIQIT